MALASTPPQVLLKTEGPVAVLHLDNPAHHNAITAAMWQAIPGLVDEARNNPAVRVIAVRGAGERAFSAGADISEFETARSGSAVKSYDALNEAAFAALAGCPKPTVAVIQGPCLGGGLGLALCCDLRLAGDTATFAIPAARLGLGYPPRWLLPLLTAVSPASAKEILFTAERFSAAQALSMGLVNRVYSAATLFAAAAELMAVIAANAPLTLAAAKAAIGALAREGAAADLAALERQAAACFESADYAEGRRAFLEKRSPQFSGR